MKLYSITRVQNEKDILESLCRYTVNFCDGMIIYDNDSQDNTPEIIRKLVAEGLPIHFAEDLKEQGVPIDEVNDAMSRMAFEKFGADMVLPLDADEFLLHKDGHNPRETLASLDPHKEHRMKWRSYLYSHAPNDNTRFLPDYFNTYRDPEADHLCKVVISRYLFETYGAKRSKGNHELVYPGLETTPVPVQTNSDLFFGHYPLRSLYQAMTKVIANEVFLLLQVDRKDGEGFHYKAIFDRIRETGTLTDEEIRHMSMLFSLAFERQKQPLNLFEGKLDTSFCTMPLTLKYTNYTPDTPFFYRTLFGQIADNAEFWGNCHRKAAAENARMAHELTFSIRKQISRKIRRFFKGKV